MIRVQPKVLQHFHQDEQLKPKPCNNNENEISLQQQAYLSTSLKLIQMQTLSLYQMKISFLLAQCNVASLGCRNRPKSQKALEKGTGENPQFQEASRHLKLAVFQNRPNAAGWIMWNLFWWAARTPSASQASAVTKMFSYNQPSSKQLGHPKPVSIIIKWDWSKCCRPQNLLRRALVRVRTRWQQKQRENILTVIF